MKNNPTDDNFEIEPREEKPIAPSIEITPTIPPQPEIKIPRKAVFGGIEVQEDLNSDLLSQQEKVLHRGGFEILKDVVESADNNIDRMVLTTPDVVSGIVGLQPLVSMDTGEAALVYQSYKRAGIDFNQDYSFLEFGKERDYLKIFINDKAAENILRTYQKQLRIILPTHSLSKGEVISYVTGLLGNQDTRSANLAHGLLSGFPLEDCQNAVNGGMEVNAIPPLKKIENLDNRFLLRLNPISLLNPDNYAMTGTKNHYLPDARNTLRQGTKADFVEGFGLRWITSFPPKASTQQHCQKVLQVDRELGLLNFVNQQRATFNVADNIKGINTAKKLANKPESKIGKLGKTALGIVGIFSIFNTIINWIDPPNKPQQTA